MNSKYMVAYKISYINSYGEKEAVDITDNPHRWLEHNNKIRISNGNEPKKLDDFEIESIHIELFPWDTYPEKIWVAGETLCPKKLSDPS